MENQTRRFGSLSSSTNPQQLATSVSGIIIGFSALIVYGAALMGFTIVDAQVSGFATQVGLAIGSLTALYGIIRKVVVAVNAKFFM